MNKNEEIMVSIIMVTYNHEKYIAQAIESIVCQKTDYKFELLIGDDASTDHTPEIITEYYKKYPNIIKTFLRKKNVGATKNGYYLMKSAKGKYFSSCEGDDFWCDKTKIQSDIDFLEQHNEYVGICGRTQAVREDGTLLEENLAQNVQFWKFDREEYELKDFEEWKMPGHLSGMTAVNIAKEMDDISLIYKAHSTVGDRTTILLVSLLGAIKCTKKVQTCYRFRNSLEGNNFMAEFEKKNLRDEDYLMLRRMEIWTKKNKNIHLNLDQIKKDRFAGSIIVFLKNPSGRNWSVVWNIIRYSESPIRYTGYLIKTIVLKEYYWNVLKTDKRIQL